MKICIAEIMYLLHPKFLWHPKSLTTNNFPVKLIKKNIIYIYILIIRNLK